VNKKVFNILDLHPTAIRLLDDDGKDVHIMYTLRGMQDLPDTAINWTGPA
jgi:hypothetical protein